MQKIYIYFMPPAKKRDSLQLDLFGESAQSERRASNVSDLDETLQKSLNARDIKAARHAARKQEELLKKIIEEKRAPKPGRRGS